MDRRQVVKGVAFGATALFTAGFARSTRADSSLMMAHVFLPAQLDPSDAGNSAFNLVEAGLAETLVRVDRSLVIEPWLAESVDNIDPTTWEIRLRKNGRFWDGSPVDAAAVVDSLTRTLAEQPDAASYIDPATVIVAVDEWTVRVTTPEPQGNLLNSLANFNFIIQKPDDASGPSMTGAYKPVQLIAGEVLEMERFADHWRGVPGFERITVKLISDANVRVLALQAGDVDLISQVPVQMFASLGNDLALASVSSSRVHSVIFNFESPAMQEQAVRVAIARAIDRETLNTIALDGQGTVTAIPFPAGFAGASPRDTVADPASAGALLDEAGWSVGEDGKRVRDGSTLAIKLLSYPNRPELTAMAVSIQDQLKGLGITVEVREVEDIMSALESDPWDATMWSFNPLPTGDVMYVFNTALRTGGVFNPGGYSNQAIDEIADRLRTETDAEQRSVLTEEAVSLVVDDAAAVWLLSPARGFAYDPEVVAELSVSPNDQYMIDEAIRPAE
jgi:peptide/nickel transport system substrate-binding protein